MSTKKNIYGSLFVSNNITGDTLNLSTVNNNDSLTEILARNSANGDVEYRDVQSIISAATSQDTFVTGGTFNDTLNELTLKRNDSFNIVISGFTSGAQFGTTYFVAPEGNDLTGEYGNISKPFKTITGARNQLLVDSLSGQTLIYVFPGTYDEAELQYPNGKMYLSPGSLIKPSAKIEGAGAAMTAVNQGTKTFTFNANWATYLNVGKKFRVVGGANDGTYTIVSATDVGGTTEVVVSEAISSASVGGKLRNNETVFTLGSTPLNAPSGSTSNNFELYGEGDIDIVKSLDDDWSGGIVTAFGSAEFYGEAVTWRQEKGVLMGGYENSKMTFNGSTLELYGNSGYVTTARDSSDTTFNFDRIISNGSYTFLIRYGSNPTFNGSCVVTSNVIKAVGSSQAIGLQRMGPGGRVVINSPIVESESFTLNAAQNSGGEFILNGNIVATTANGSGVVTGLDFGNEAKFTINGNITIDSNRVFWGVGSVNSSWYLNGNLESLSGSTNPIIDLGSGSGSINLNGSIKNTDGGTTLDGISTGGVDIIVENLHVVADNETITSSSPQTVEILHSLSINNPLNSNITTTGLYNFTGTTNVGDLLIYNTPTNDDSLTQILGRNSTTGEIEYRDVQSIISAATAQDTFVTGFTYDDANTFTITDNDGGIFSSSINTITGLTSNGSIEVAGNVVVTGGTGNVLAKQFYVENNLGLDWDFPSSSVVLGNNVDGTIINGNNLTVNTDALFNGNVTGNSLTLSSITNDDSLTEILARNSSGLVEYRDVTSIIGAASADTYVVSGNADVATSQLTFTYNTGGTFTVTNSAALFADNDINVTGGTYNPTTGCVTFSTNSGTTFDVCGFVTGITDSYTTGATLAGETIQFDNNISGLDYYNVSLTPLLSGKTNLSLFNSHTANTSNPHQTSFSNLTNTAHTHTISEVINLQNELDDKLETSVFNIYSGNVSTQLSTKIENGINVGGANEIFSGKSGTDFYFRTISGGTNTTITTVGDIVNFDVEVDVTRVQGGTNISTGGTENNPVVNLNDNIVLNSVSATTLSGGTLYSGSTDLSDIFLTTADGNDITRVSGGVNISTGGTANNPIVNLDDDISLNSISATTLSGGTLYSGSTDLYNIIESLDTYITGGTYDDSTDSITLDRNDSGTVVITGVSDTFYWTTGSTGTFSLKAINDSGLDATGNYAVAEGFNTLASGAYSHAEGFGTTASSPEAHSEGYETTASGEDSHSQNLFTVSSGDYSHAEGWSTIASGEDSHAEGFGTLASAADSHAEGLNTTSSGTASHSEGFNTIATGTASHSEGFDTNASNDTAHAEGYSSTASGLASHSEGFETTAVGSFSHAGGSGSIASGSTSFIHSTNSLVTGDRSVVLGGQNITGITNDTVYVPILNINELATGTSINNIGIDSSGNVVTGSDENTFVTGTTFSSNQAILSRSDAFDVFKLSGGSNVSLSSTGSNEVKIDVSIPAGMNTFVTGFTYDGSNNFNISDNSGNTFSATINEVTGLTSNGNLQINGNIVVTGNTLISGNTTIGNDLEPNVDNVIDLGAPSFRWREIYTTNLDATNAISSNSLYASFGVSSPSISGTSISATTFYSGSTDLSDLFLTTADGNDITRIQPGTNINTGGTENNPVVNLDDDISLSSVSATTISGGTFYGDGSNLSGITDFYLTGQTFNNLNYTLTSSLNNGSNLNTDLSVLASDIFVVSGVYSPSTGVVTYTNSSGGTFNVSGFTTGMTDSYTDAANLNGNTIEFDNNIQGSNIYSVDLSPALSAFTTGDTYVTGFTYNDANTLTVSRNDGVDISTSINTLTGITINGILSATTYTGITLTDLDDVTTNIPSTPDNTYQGELVYFDVASNQWVSGNEYGNLGQVTIWGKKGSAGTIDKGCPVYIVGFDDDIHEVELANATTGTTMPVIGFTAEDFDNSGVYPIVTFGKITGLDTSSATTVVNPFGETWEVNDVLYMAKTDGGLTKFRPSGTNTEIQRIAKVLKVGVSDGQLFIFNTARTAGLPNLTTDYLWLGNGNDTPQEVIRTDVGITVTGFTYNDNNTFIINDDNGGSFSSTINQMSGLTINGTLSATTLDANTILSGGTSLTNIIESLDTYVTGGTVSVPATDNTNSGTIGLFYKNSDGIPRTLPFEDTYTTGSTYDNGTALATFDRNDGTSYTLDLSSIDVNDTFVTGTTFGSNQAILSRNDAIDVLKITGDTNVVLSNPSTNQVKIGLDLGIKSGTVRGADFTGSPLTIKVTFTTPYPDTDYSVNITGSVNRNFTFENKTAASFFINSNSSTSFLNDVDWTTIKYGEQ